MEITLWTRKMVSMSDSGDYISFFRIEPQTWLGGFTDKECTHVLKSYGVIIDLFSLIAIRITTDWHKVEV